MSSAAPGLAALYDAAAEDYERTCVPRLRPLAKKLLELYDTRPNSRVLDAGTATGLVATLVAPRAGRVGRVIGVDLSAARLAIARAKARNFGFTQCEFRGGDVNALAFADGEFDLVICAQELWGEPARLWSEFHRVLKAKGTLLAQNWSPARAAPDRVYQEILEQFRLSTPEAQLAALRAAQRRQIQDWEALAAPADYESALGAAGLNAQARHETLALHFENAAAYVEWSGRQALTRAELAALPEARRAEFARAAVDALQRYETGKGLDFERTAVQVLAHK